MKLRKTIQDRRLRRKQRSLESWERKRAQGKTRFVVETALTASFTVVGGSHAIDHLFFDGTYSISLVTIAFFALFGLCVAPSTWSKMEAKYEDALREARAKALRESKNPLISQDISRA